MSSTTSSRRPAFSPEDILGYLSRNVRPDPPRWSSSVFPCPCEVFLVLSAVVYDYKSSQGSPVTDRLDAPRKVEGYRNALRRHTMDPVLSLEEMGLAECYRAAAILFVNGLFEHPAKTTESHDLVATIIGHATALLSINPRQRFLLWPLYQAGLDCKRDSEAARWIEGYFSRLSRSSGCQHGFNGLVTLRAFWADGGSCGDRISPSSTDLEGQLTLV